MSQPKAVPQKAQRPKFFDTWTAGDGGVQAYCDVVERSHCWWWEIEDAVIAHGMSPEEYAAAEAKADEWFVKVTESPDPAAEYEALDVWAMSVFGPYAPFEQEWD